VDCQLTERYLGQGRPLLGDEVVLRRHGAGLSECTAWQDIGSSNQGDAGVTSSVPTNAVSVHRVNEHGTKDQAGDDQRPASTSVDLRGGAWPC
jgi:hypothetical protein